MRSTLFFKKLSLSQNLAWKSCEFLTSSLFTFCHDETKIGTFVQSEFAYFVWSKMSVNGIIMFLGMNNTRLERKILIILDFENGFLPTYLPQYFVGKKLY